MYDNIIENLLIYCCFCNRRYYKRLNDFKKNGYFLHKPKDYTEEKYGKYKRRCWHITVYYKYGLFYNINNI